MVLRKLSQGFKITLALMLSVLSSGILQVAPAFAAAANDKQVYCNIEGESGKWKAQISNGNTEHEYPLTGVFVHDQNDVTSEMDAACESQYSPDGTLIVTPGCEEGTFSGTVIAPADGEATYEVNGIARNPDTLYTGLTPGSYTVDMFVNGTLVDSKTVEVEACETTAPTPVTPQVSAAPQVCKEGDTTQDVIVTVTNTSDETDAAAIYDVTIGTETVKTGSIADGSSGRVTFTGLPAGMHTVNVLGSDGTTASTTVNIPVCEDEAIDVCKNVDGDQTQSDLDQYAPYVFVQGKNNCKIMICHRTNAATNPYTNPSVSLRAVDGQGKNDHSHHTGPIFDPATMTNGDDWGDIIPPNFYNEDGMNWTEGKAILDAGCNPEKGASTTKPVKRDFCGESHDRIVIPNREGVIYSIDGEEVGSGSMLVADVDGNSDSVLHVTAAAASGYVLHEDSKTSWTFSYTDENCLSITKTLSEFKDMNGDNVIGIGDRAYWTITVTNNGDKSVEHFTVDVSDMGATVDGVSSVNNLRPGKSFVVSAYTVISAENIGTVCKVTNTASFGANYFERQMPDLFTAQTEGSTFEFTGTVNAEATFTCPPTGNVGGTTDVCPNISGTQETVPSGLTRNSSTGECLAGGGQGGGHVLATSTVLPAMLPATGAKDSPYMILVAALIAYGATYFLQGRRKLLRNQA